MVFWQRIDGVHVLARFNLELTVWLQQLAIFAWSQLKGFTFSFVKALVEAGRDIWYCAGTDLEIRVLAGLTGEELLGCGASQALLLGSKLLAIVYGWRVLHEIKAMCAYIDLVWWLCSSAVNQRNARQPSHHGKSNQCSHHHSLSAILPMRPLGWPLQGACSQDQQS